MSIQTTYLRPEDDPANWFSGTEVIGPAIITAIIGGRWHIYDHDPGPTPTSAQPFITFSETKGFHKLFVKAGHSLKLDRMITPVGLISGYYLPPRA